MNNKNLLLLIFVTATFLFSNNPIYSQNWTWIKGSNTINQTGIFGTLGIPSSSNVPTARIASITFTDVDGNLWLFGGKDNSNNLYNDLWKYNISTNQWTWINGSSSGNSLANYGSLGIPSSTNVPGSRENGVGWVDENNNLWIFGGNGYANSLSSFGRLNDLWKYNIATNQWTWVKGSSSVNGIGVYGTIGVPNNNNVPGARNSSSSWYHNNKLYLFGGDATSIGYSGDLWEYNIATNQWTWLKGSNNGLENPTYGIQGVYNSSNVPGARGGTCSWNNNTGELYLFGGTKGSNIFYSDLWKYNISTNQWTWLKGPNNTNITGTYGTQGVASSTNNPGARHKSIGNYVVNNNLYLFGGYGYYSNGGPYYLNDLWKLDLNTLQWTFIKGSTGSGQIGIYGTQGLASTNNSPGAREYHSSWKDNNGNFWIFGGWGFANNSTFGYLNDLWVYSNPCSISAPTGNIAQTLCSGSTVANLSATGTSIQWYSTSTGGTALASTTVLVNGTTYYASQTVNSCESTTRLAVTITLNNPTVSASATTVCSGQPTTLTATPGVSSTSNFSVGSIGPAGGYVFYDKGSVTNGWRYLEAAPSNIQNSSWGCGDVNISGATSLAIGSGLTNTNAIVATCTTPSIAARRCLDHSVNGYDDWYLPSQNEFAQIYQNLIVNNLGNFNVGPIPSMGTLYWTSSQLTAASGSHCCLECGGNFYQYSKVYELYVRPVRQFASGTPFSSYLWSTGATTASISVNPSTTTQYWVDVTTNGVTCRKFITITVNSITPAPTGSTAQTFCSGSTVANLTATGTNIKWYATSTGGTALASTTALVNGTTYYASQTVSGCESTNRLAVTVTLNNHTVSASSTTVCSGQPTTLTASSNLSTSQIQTQVNNLINSGLWSLLVTYNNHYYFQYQTRMTWPQAKVLCEQNGGYMYCVNTQLENDNVSVPIANSQVYGDFLLGLFQDTTDPNYSEPSGGWKWLDGSSLSYTNWASIASGWIQNEPSGGSENFGIMDWSNTGPYWNDTYDNINGTVIMEYTGNSTYLWSTGATTASINVNPTTTTQYWVDITTNGVTCRKFITITVSVIPPPSGSFNQNMTQGSTLSNLIVTGQNIQWYSTPFGGTPLPLNTTLVNGTTYYASQTINGCESQDRFPVIVQVTLGNNEYDDILLAYSPNPVIDMLNIKSSVNLNLITVTNVIGQLVFKQTFNSNDVQVDMSNIPTGTYFVIIEADNRKQVFKVLKK